MLVSAVIFAGLLILGFPIYTAILACGLYIQIFLNHVTLEIVISGIFQTLTRTSIMAVPFFILSGSLMTGTSMGNLLIGAVLPWLRRQRGGVSMAVVVANEIFGAMSGSSPAATSTIGRVAYPHLEKIHGESFSLGLICSTGAIAIIMPPSISMILFATATNCSTGKLFLAGIIPALVLMVILCTYLVWVSPPVGKKEAFNMREASHQTVIAIPVLFLPILILGGIYGGVFTPTEAGCIAAVYSFVVPFALYKELRWQSFRACLMDFIRINSQLFIIVASSTVLSQALTMSYVTRELVNVLKDLHPYVFLMVFNVFLLGVGCIFDPGPAILIIAPIAAPIAEAMGINIIHLGLIMTVNLAIGMFTPPYGLNLFVAQSIFHKPLEKIARGTIPFFFLFVLCLIIVTYVPSLYMWLPNR